MSFKKAWILYTVLRLLFFAVPFAAIMLLLPASQQNGLTWGVAFAAVCAALISVSLSVLFLGKLRNQADAGIAQWRSNSHTVDSDVEDELIEQAAGEVAAPEVADGVVAEPEHVVAEPDVAEPEAGVAEPEAGAPTSAPHTT